MSRIYERDTDALFLRSFRTNPNFYQLFVKKIAGKSSAGEPRVAGQTKHRQDSGSIDIEIQFPNGLLLLIENKIDAGYSITRSGVGQAERYRRSVEALHAQGIDARSVLLAPSVYLTASRTASAFDSRVCYENLRPALTGEDLVLLDRALDQASTPYEPTANIRTMDFFSNYKNFVTDQYPTLVIKYSPNAGEVRPEGSRTIYFDVRRTLIRHAEVPRPRMSHQCWDSSAASASMKIMIGGWGKYATHLDAPQSLDDVGGYLRPAGGSLGIVIDTPRLDTQKRFDEQLSEVVEGLEASARLQAWWADNGVTIRSWSQLINGSTNDGGI